MGSWSTSDSPTMWSSYGTMYQHQSSQYPLNHSTYEHTPSTPAWTTSYAGFSNASIASNVPSFVATSDPSYSDYHSIQNTSNNVYQPAYGTASTSNNLVDSDEQQAEYRHACDKCTASFKRPGDLRRHYRKHFPETRVFSCSAPGCDKTGENGFYRRDKLMHHLRTAHSGLSSTHDQVFFLNE